MERRRMLSAGAVIFRRGPEGYRVLLLRAFRNWDFPKGEVEPGEDPLEGALREVREETGLSPVSLPLGTAHVETPPYSRGKIARYYVAEAQTSTVLLRPGPSGIREHHEYRWLAFDEARPLLVDRLRAVLDWAEGRIRSLASAGPPER
jgi:8-oxo-dGTP pyrophosphatase MutT (NUDIX family)